MGYSYIKCQKRLYMNKNILFISFVILSSILTFANESDISVDVVGVKENNIYTIEVLGLDRNKNIFESEFIFSFLLVSLIIDLKYFFASE